MVSTVNYLSTKEYVSTLVERDTTELLSSFTTESNRFSYERIVELELIADYLPYVLDDEKDLTLYLHKQNDKMPFFAGLGYIRKNGKVLTADGYEFTIQQEESFQRALNGEVAFSETFSLQQDPTQKVTAISVPVYQGEKVSGVLSGVVNMADLIGSMAEESRLPGSVFLLNGKEVVYSSSAIELKEIIPNFAEKIEGIKKGEMGSIAIEQEDAHFLAYAYTWNDFVILVDSSVNPDRSQLDAARWHNGLIILISIVVVIAVVIYVQLLEKQSRNLMRRDLLTGLGNRSLMEDELLHIKGILPSGVFAVLFISIDKFQELNERIGYQMGDRLVFAFSKKLKNIIGKSRLYRVGVEEFLVVYQTETQEDQEHIASRIVNLMNLPIQMGTESPIWITVSIGIRPTTSEEDMELVLMDALYANQEARKKGGNQFVYMGDNLAQVVSRQRLVFKELDHALENDEFYLVYQPIYGIETDSIVSFETLMRWKSSVLGDVYPSDFIPLIEENDQIIEVGRWLIKKVSMQILEWESQGYDNFTVTVNVSVRQLEDPEFVNDVRKIINETKVSPERIIFELTESVIVQNIEESSKVISTLNGIGIKTALDDFGTGYSSLSILKMLPFQYVKIDRSFVWEMENDQGISKSILKGIIEIAEGLKMTTIVEGVETEEQLRAIKEMGANRIQGYYISKPTDPDSAIKHLALNNIYNN